MRDNYEITIDANIDKDKDLQSKKHKEDQINSLENENSNSIEGFTGNKIADTQIENEEYNNFGNINETENIDKNNIINDINNNIIPSSSSDRKEYYIDKKIISQKESSSTINNTNLNDNTSTNPTKEEQNIEFNNQNQNNISQKNIQQINSNNVIDESDEYKTIENIINSKDNFIIERNINNNIFTDKNKVYFTEANIPSLKIKIQKSNFSKLYNNIASIPEYPYGYPKNLKNNYSFNSNSIKRGGSSKKVDTKSLNEKLNNLSPNDYMKKKFVNKYNFRPLQYRIKKIQEEIEKQNKYDYERVMKEFQLKYDKEIKNKERERYILEFHKKIEEKLKNMEEKRTQLYNERLEKITKKRNSSNNKIRLKKNLSRSSENIFSYKKNNTTGPNKNIYSIDSYGYITDKNEKLPVIQSLPKYELVRMMKEKLEEEFCNNTKKILKEREITHRKNYLKQLHNINNKLVKQNKLYRQRSMQCLITKKDRNAELEEEFIEKHMIKRYNIQQNLLREWSAKKERIRHNLIRNSDSLRENRKLLEKKDEEKIKQIIKRLNRKKTKQDYSNNLYNHREFLENLQRKNLIQYNKEIRDYYNELILRQGENVLIANELQKDEPDIRQEIIKRTLKEQNKKFKKLKKLDNYLVKMDKININNQSEGTKRKLYQEKIKIENEQKIKEEEEKLK